MRYLAVLLLSSALLACTTTQGPNGVLGNNRTTTTVDDLSDQDKLFYQMGIQYIERGEYEVAEEKLIVLVPRYPKFTELYVMLGVIQEKQGKTSDAAGLYSKAIVTDPMDRMAIKHYAKLQCGDHDANAPSRMASIADAAPAELKAGMSSGASGCFYIHGDYARANEYADKGIQANPNYADTYFFKALAVNKLNRPEEVFPALDRYHDKYGYESVSVHLGLEAAKKARNQAEIKKYEDIIARPR